jgi:hypothetical protein
MSGLILQQLPAGFSLCNAAVAYNPEQSEDSGVAIVRLRIYRWCGLVAAIPLLVLATTGCVMAFEIAD